MNTMWKILRKTVSAPAAGTFTPVQGTTVLAVVAGDRQSMKSILHFLPGVAYEDIDVVAFLPSELATLCMEDDSMIDINTGDRFNVVQVNSYRAKCVVYLKQLRIPAPIMQQGL